MLAEQHVPWKEQGINALSFQKAGFQEQLKTEAARDEVHVAVAQATEMC